MSISCAQEREERYAVTTKRKQMSESVGEARLVSPQPGPLPWGEGEPSWPRGTIQSFRLSLRGARCSLSLRERVRARGNGANDLLAYRTIPGTVELDESSGEAGGFQK